MSRGFGGNRPTHVEKPNDSPKVKTINYKELVQLMAEFYVHSPETSCLFCESHKNVLVRGTRIVGCDRNCYHSRRFTAEDLIELFVKELEKDEVKINDNEWD